jgi:superfamily II DNA or RNA helicase
MLSIVRELLIESEICGEQFSHALVYCAPGTHKEVLKNLSDLNIKCHEFVHNVSLKERQKLLGEFESGKIQILVAVKCLDEGVDVPSTKMAFFLSSTSNPKEFVQRRGRVLRKSVNKSEAILYDFFVVPDTEHISLKRDIDAGLLKREMPRFAEFSNSAKNQYEARQVFWDILDNYDLLHLLDEKPWEVYKKMVDQSDLIQAEEGNYV